MYVRGGGIDKCNEGEESRVRKNDEGLLLRVVREVLSLLGRDRMEEGTNSVKRESIPEEGRKGYKR